ncbi:MAG: amidohydrolase [Hyphomicrobiales bacterium]
MHPTRFKTMTRRALLGAMAGVSAAAVAAICGGSTLAQTQSLSDLSDVIAAAPSLTIYTARKIITLDPARPTAEAVAVAGDRIVAAGSLDEVKAAVGEKPVTVDTTFAEKVIVPGFFAQHDHPILAALTMSSEILSIEDWVLPSGTVKAVTDKQDFLTRLAAAEKKLTDPNEALLTWGYHAQFFGKLTRKDVDTVSTTRPILVWSRSCHEFVINSAAMQRAKLDEAVVAGWSASQRKQSNVEEGHFWEQGLFAAMPSLAPMVANPQRLTSGLELVRDYMQAKGVTLGCEPGGVLAKPVQDAVNSVFSSPAMPFRWYFIVDGKSMADRIKDDSQVVPESEKIAAWYGGMTAQSVKQVKLFADGAIYSQAMQVREPYLDHHEGEWMTDLDVFQRAFRIYWDAGYQVHVHVNGDAGLDRVLDTLEENLKRTPRTDHRTVIVHFAVSAPDQVARIAKLGAIVSGNPYYVTALADQYGKVGLGPERADEMVRLGDVTRAGVSYSLHSDMPMAPCDPLFLMWCAVNRITPSGRVAGPEQRVSAEGALRGVTLEAAYSLQLEHEVGSIVPGKRANFTILGDDPLAVDPLAIKDIKVWGTVMEGRVIPSAAGQKRASIDVPSTADPGSFALAALEHAYRFAHMHVD